MHWFERPGIQLWMWKWLVASFDMVRFTAGIVPMSHALLVKSHSSANTSQNKPSRSATLCHPYEFYFSCTTDVRRTLIIIYTIPNIEFLLRKKSKFIETGWIEFIYKKKEKIIYIHTYYILHIYIATFPKYMSAYL